MGGSPPPAPPYFLEFEMKEASKWVLFCIVVMLLFTGIGMLLRPLNMFVDRQAAVNSHQYIEGRENRVAILEANKEEVEALLRKETDPTVRGSLEAQRSALNAQIKAARR